MTTTPRFAITLMASATHNKEVLFNEAMVVLDALAHPIVISNAVMTPPASGLTLGDTYIIPAGATGAWAGYTDYFAVWFNGWRLVQPVAGMFVRIESEDNTFRYVAGTGWVVNTLSITSLTSVPGVSAGDLTTGAVLTYDATTLTYSLVQPTLAALTDADLTDLADGSLLQWDAATSKWVVVDPADILDPANVKTAYETNADTNAFTDAEKAKLAALESSKFLGTFVNLAALEAAYPSPVEGSYAHVDAGVGDSVLVYIWDASDSSYVAQSGAGTVETAASIKTKYESNADTNAFTDAEKAKLAGIEAGATAGGGTTTVTEVTAGMSVTNTHLGGNQVVKVNSATAVTITVPSGLTGTEPVVFIRKGAGTVTFAASGTTLLSADGYLNLRAQYSSAMLLPSGVTDTYYLVGDIA